MITSNQKELFKDEIKYNLRGSYWHFRFFCKLLTRYLKKKTQRSTEAVYNEYNDVWENFWEDRLFFSNDRYPFLENGKLMEPMISPFQYQLTVTDPLIANYIQKHQCQSVLEIGSGTGVHFLNLCTQFPDTHFYGIELTQSGVDISRKLLASPPKEFEAAHKQGGIKNATIIHGSILDSAAIEELKKNQYDLVFSTLVLEQLHNYLDQVFTNVFQLDFKHFLFHEQWFESNTYMNKYRMLIDFDYFRAPTSFLNKFPAKVIETIVPAKQPMGMNIVGVFGEKRK